MKNWIKLALSVSAGTLLLFPFLLAAQDPADTAGDSVAAVADCERVAPRSMPRYAIAGLWTGGAQRDTFVLVEPAERRLAFFDRGERALGQPPAAIASTIDYMQPVGASALPDGGMVLEAAGGRFWQLDSDMLPVTGVYDVGRDAGIADFFPFRWEVVGNGLATGGLIACGDVQYEAGGPWTSGIFFVPTDEGPGAGVRQIHLFEDLGDLNRLGCRLGGQIFAVVNGVPYVLLLSGIEDGTEAVPQIYRIDVDGRSMTPLELIDRPEEMRVSPPLATFWPASQWAALMKDIEASTMPTEMVSWNDALYVVLRQPSSQRGGGSDFRIARVDPGTGNVVAARLESEAHHLTLVSGPDRFAVVEKEAAHGLGDHRVRGFQLVPTERMTALQWKVAICR